jgi:ATF/CREB family transcription factor
MTRHPNSSTRQMAKGVQRTLMLTEKFPPDAPESKPTESAVKTESTSNAEPSQPLAPPPRPAPVGDTPDYFSGAHGTHLSYEPNPFEQSFSGSGSIQTPGGTKLPSVAALTSPASLLPGGGTTPFNWSGSLRTGPLSPAMLSGPTNDYFGDGHHLRGAFPTPNESSLRTGLTPGGSGSMFPAASPNSQALFNQLASGGATPGTLDFHRTAMNASAIQKREQALAQQQQQQQQNNVTSQPQEQPNGIESKPPQNSADMFGQHDANDAANGLFLLAQARNGAPNTNQYTMAPQQPVHAHPQPTNSQIGSADTSPHMRSRNGNGSIGTNISGSVRGTSEFSDEGEQQRPNTRGKGKRGSTAGATTNGRRKADETPTKQPAAKKGKSNNGNAMSAMEPEPASEEEQDMSKDEYNAQGKKMTDEEKRKNFLERNRYVMISTSDRSSTH